MKKVVFIALACAILAAPASARAEQIKHYPDPAYRLMNAQDVHPMSDLEALANDDDVRAQFILGDLFSKGKGGYKQNLARAHYWFERSAKLGYQNSLPRLAALAKRRDRPVEAYMWYTLALERFSSGKMQRHLTRARADHAAAAKLTEAEKRKAREMMAEWKKKKPEDIVAEKAAAEKAAKVEPRAGDAAAVVYGPVLPNVLIPEIQAAEEGEIADEQD